MLMDFEILQKQQGAHTHNCLISKEKRDNILLRILYDILWTTQIGLPVQRAMTL